MVGRSKQLTQLTRFRSWPERWRWDINLGITFFVLVSSVIFGGGPSEAQLLEYEVKAGFLFNLVRFTKWPDAAFPTTGSALTLCVVGDNPFGPYLDDFAGRRVQERTTVVREATLDSVTGCHVLFVARSEEARINLILRRVEGLPMLVIADMDDFAARGGAINLVVRRGKVGLEINPDSIKRAGLSLATAVLQLATIVKSSR